MKLTKDRVPVVIHDATLDRTTPCTGQVSARTFAELRAELPVGHPRAPTTTSCSSARATAGARPIPKLSEVLALARAHGRAREPRDQEPARPTRTSTTRPPTPTTVIDAIKASGFPPSRLIIQSLLVPEPRTARRQLLPGRRDELPDARRPASPVAFADRRGDDWVSPQWPARRRLRGHGARRSACAWCPYTLDARDDIAAAVTAGVDELITNDPLLARRTEARARPGAGADPAAAERVGLPRRARAAARSARSRRYGSRRHGLRVFAMQLKQEARHVETYATLPDEDRVHDPRARAAAAGARGARTWSPSTRTSA